MADAPRLPEHDFLATTPAFGEAPAEVLAWLAANVAEVRFRKGSTLLREGGADRDCYVLVEGEVEISAGGSVVDRHGPGNVEGELGLLYRRPRSATAKALTPVVALRIGADDFDELCRTDAATATAFAETVIEYLRFRFGFRPPGPWRVTPG